MDLKELEQEWIQLTLGRPCVVLLRKAEGPLKGRATRSQESKMARQLEHEIKDFLIKQGVSADLIKTTVSHTSTSAGSWVMGAGSDQRIGIDLESSQRRVHPRVGFRLLTRAESNLGLSILEAWVAKEAAFKANPNNSGTLLPQYQITGWDAGNRTGEIQLPPTEGEMGVCRFKVVASENWLVGMAVFFPSKGV